MKCGSKSGIFPLTPEPMNEMCRFHRGMTRPFFSKDRISDFDLFDRHADVALEKIKERCKENVPFDFQVTSLRPTSSPETELSYTSRILSDASHWIARQNSYLARTLNRSRIRFPIHSTLAFRMTDSSHRLANLRKHSTLHKYKLLSE